MGGFERQAEVTARSEGQGPERLSLSGGGSGRGAPILRSVSEPVKKPAIGTSSKSCRRQREPCEAESPLFPQSANADSPLIEGVNIASATPRTANGDPYRVLPQHPVKYIEKALSSAGQRFF